MSYSDDAPKDLKFEINNAYVSVYGHPRWWLSKFEILSASLSDATCICGNNTIGLHKSAFDSNISVVWKLYWALLEPDVV